MTTIFSLPRAARVVRFLRRAAARQRLPDRARADHGLHCRHRAARAAQPRRDIRRAGARDAGATAGATRRVRRAVRPPFSRQEAIDRADDGEDEDIVRLHEEGRGDDEPLAADEANESGQAAARAEALVERRFAPRRNQRRAAPPVPRGARPSAAAARPSPPARAARPRSPICAARCATASATTARCCSCGACDGAPRPRRILLLIDVSGSMKARTDEHLRLAHALAQAAAAESRSSPSARGSPGSPARFASSSREQALAAAAHRRHDWDGGTRIGDALQAFLAVPRFAGFARGAAVVILSDGLERGEPDAHARRRAPPCRASPGG